LRVMVCGWYGWGKWVGAEILRKYIQVGVDKICKII
jgi:hypothetical protein